MSPVISDQYREGGSGRTRLLQIGAVLLMTTVSGMIPLMGNPRTPQTIPRDTSQVNVRKPAPELLQRYRLDARFQYESRGPEASWWDRLWNAIGGFAARILFSNTGYVRWTTVLLAAAILIYAIVRGTGHFPYSPVDSSSTTVPGNKSSETDGSGEPKIDQRLAETLSQGRYREAVRLYYLKGVDLLQRHQLIPPGKNKTDVEYLAELQRSSASRELMDSFQRMTHVFEFTWYGDFPAGEPLADSMRNWFHRLEAQLDNDTS